MERPSAKKFSAKQTSGVIIHRKDAPKAAVALADAGIPMKDLVCAVAVGKIDGLVAVDFSKDEDNYGESDMPIAIAPRNGDVLLFQMDGNLTREELSAAMEMAYKASAKISELQAAALKAVYDGPKKEAHLVLGDKFNSQ